MTPRLSALEAEHILTLSQDFARAAAAYAMAPFDDEWLAMKKADKTLRGFVYKLAGSE